MRRVDSLSDVQIVLNELLSWKDLQISKAKDQRGLQIKNAGDATDPTDLVTLRQLTQSGISRKKTLVAGNFQAAGEFSFQSDQVYANPGVLVAVNNFSVDITQYQRVNFCYAPVPITGSNLVVNIRITSDYGSTWMTLETLTISVGQKNSWAGLQNPNLRETPYSGTAPFRVLLAGDQLNFTVESGFSNGLTIKLDTKASA